MGFKIAFPIFLFLTTLFIAPNWSFGKDNLCLPRDQNCQLVIEHNRQRRSAQPAPKPPLKDLQWSSEIEKAAMDWAEKCSFTHDPNLDSLNMGQNLFASTYPHSAKDVVDAWAEESADYNYSTNTCDRGKVCGHYTQIVWRNSTRLGCATVSCSKNSPWARTPWYITVCNYIEPGNWRGQKPY